jgi:hypothetical protein
VKEHQIAVYSMLDDGNIGKITLSG